MTEMRQRSNGLIDYDASLRDYFLELDCRASALICRQVRFPANVRGIHCNCETPVRRQPELIRRRLL